MVYSGRHNQVAVLVYRNICATYEVSKLPQELPVFHTDKQLLANQPHAVVTDNDR